MITIPNSPIQLDVNGGEKILLRLRSAHDPARFLDEAQVVQTMLHEVQTRKGYASRITMLTFLLVDP